MTNDHEPAANDRDTPLDLYALPLSEEAFVELKNTGLAYAEIPDAVDTFAIRDLSNLEAGTLRLPGEVLRLLGASI